MSKEIGKATTDAEFAAFKADIVAALVGTPQATTAGAIPTCAPERFKGVAADATSDWKGPCPVCNGRTFAAVSGEEAPRFQRCVECKAVIDLNVYQGTRAQVAAVEACAPAYHAQAALPTYDPATHVLVERMTRGDWTSMHSPTLSGHGSFAWADHVGIIKPDPDPIAEYAARHCLDVDELRELVKGAAA